MAGQLERTDALQLLSQALRDACETAFCERTNNCAHWTLRHAERLAGRPSSFVVDRAKFGDGVMRWSQIANHFARDLGLVSHPRRYRDHPHDGEVTLCLADGAAVFGIFFRGGVYLRSERGVMRSSTDRLRIVRSWRLPDGANSHSANHWRA